MIEVMIAASILFSTITIFIPITSQIQIEKKVLRERRAIAYQLQEELQQYIWTDNNVLPSTFTFKQDAKLFHFQFIEDNNFVRGCVQWENAKEIDESFCLYALPTE